MKLYFVETFKPDYPTPAIKLEGVFGPFTDYQTAQEAVMKIIQYTEWHAAIIRELIAKGDVTNHPLTTTIEEKE